MNVPREVLQIVFLIAGPSSFGIFRLVCKQWKRVVDSEEVKVIVARNPRCHISQPPHWSWFEVHAGIGRAEKEDLQFIPQTFSLFPNNNNHDAVAELFDMDFWNLDPPGFYNQIEMQRERAHVVTQHVPNTVAIEMDKRECWQKSMPEIEITEIKEHPNPWKIEQMNHIMRMEKWNQIDEETKSKGEEIKRKWANAKSLLPPPRQQQRCIYVSGGL